MTTTALTARELRKASALMERMLASYSYDRDATPLARALDEYARATEDIRRILAGRS